MLTPSERRVVVALLCWLASGLLLDVVLVRRPGALVPWLGPERAFEVTLAGGGESAEPQAAFASALAARKKPGHDAKSARGRAVVYDAQGRLDLNRADSTELLLLPGVGPALAGRILAERARRGAFRTAQDLLDVRGIGEKTLAKLLPKVAVAAAQDSLAADSSGR